MIISKDRKQGCCASGASLYYINIELAARMLPWLLCSIRSGKESSGRAEGLQAQEAVSVDRATYLGQVDGSRVTASSEKQIREPALIFSGFSCCCCCSSSSSSSSSSSPPPPPSSSSSSSSLFVFVFFVSVVAAAAVVVCLVLVLQCQNP